ncbi:NAD-dependent epimerase/dehydratase family protein [Streptomyces sp. NPDC087300]|uniref:NAD-dependent epimerase/dehydratase family protein n=1 Tax=Streptomyces sp. NPDC087300 TaxID=3365780 RepID=UPI0038215E1D
MTGSAGLVGSAVVRGLRALGRPVVGVDRLPSAAAGVSRFVYTSSTSVYGHALVPKDGAVRVTEDVTCRPRDIYDETKLAAEHLALSASGTSGAAGTRTPVTMSTLCLRIARSFPEPPAVLARHRLYRGVDLADVTEAHLLAVHAPEGADGVLNIAGPYPWRAADRKELWLDPATLITRRLPQVAAGFARSGWELPASIDRVYVSERAESVLGYRPRHGISALLAGARATG